MSPEQKRILADKLMKHLLSVAIQLEQNSGAPQINTIVFGLCTRIVELEDRTKKLENWIEQQEDYEAEQGEHE